MVSEPLAPSSSPVLRLTSPTRLPSFYPPVSLRLTSPRPPPTHFTGRAASLLLHLFCRSSSNNSDPLPSRLLLLTLPVSDLSCDLLPSPLRSAAATSVLPPICSSATSIFGGTFLLVLPYFQLLSIALQHMGLGGGDPPENNPAQPPRCLTSPTTATHSSSLSVGPFFPEA